MVVVYIDWSFIRWVILFLCVVGLITYFIILYNKSPSRFRYNFKKNMLSTDWSAVSLWQSFVTIILICFYLVLFPLAVVGYYELAKIEPRLDFLILILLGASKFAVFGSILIVLLVIVGYVIYKTYSSENKYNDDL